MKKFLFPPPQIDGIHATIVKLYCPYLAESDLKEHIGLKYQLFKDTAAKEKYNDDSYMGLSHDFFSSDLKMVKEFLENGKMDFSQGMLSDLVNYICAPHDWSATRKRHDFVRPKNKEVFFTEMSEILNAGNAPLGKWPSRYRPALMQQVAISTAISSCRQGVFQDNGNVFSVNGPPGTGKTTLLKEIIANDIVEKAKFLSQYTEPDKAFEAVRFTGGKIDGKYSTYFPSWYRFKDDKIAEYGVLVASCNNAAVENITKELPLKSGLLGNLKAVTQAPHPDSPEMLQRLDEIRTLFSPSEAAQESAHDKGAESPAAPADIYYTEYAKKLFGGKGDDADAWGLIAAPLGKKSNISQYYYDVLSPLFNDYMKKNEAITNRLPEYRNARKAFCAQLKHVTELQGQLQQYGNLVLDLYRKKNAFAQIKETAPEKEKALKAQISALDQRLTALNAQVKKENDSFEAMAAQCAEIDRRIDLCKAEIRNWTSKEKEYRQKARDAESSTPLLTKLFMKSKYQEALEAARSYEKEAQKCAEAAAGCEVRLREENAKLQQQNAKKNAASDKLRSTREKATKLRNERNTLCNSRKNREAQIADAENALSRAQSACDIALAQFRKAGEMKSGLVLNQSFIDDVLSPDAKVSTKAQVANPWSTEEFNLEREKLFYLALQMTKAFLMSSTRCRSNLHILCQYWKIEEDQEKNKYQFQKADSEAMLGSLFQTLLLLTPVISTTFASLGNLLKDINTPGVFGTLVIDEAGQAQPQMAVGGFFRARKAIVVGDPKQVEPVVTDDLKLLKEAYSDTVYTNYKSKSLSVQACADIINPFGTYFDNGTDFPDWVGCPLLVHRRCISPMYEISNRISYDGIMKQQTPALSKAKVASFIYDRSQWLNITGPEIGNKSHYVPMQGAEICKMVEIAFEKASALQNGKTNVTPKLYIITPFTSVVKGTREAILRFARQGNGTALSRSSVLDDWLKNNIGTVHKFQGKEADEVIFALGCDFHQKKKYAVKSFVNSNIVNVAATRAKYRFYIVGDLTVWNSNPYVREAKAIMDTLPIENIAKIESWKDSEGKKTALQDQLRQLPAASSFVVVPNRNPLENAEPDIHTQDFVSSIDKAGFLNSNLSQEQYRAFGFSSKEEFDSLSPDVQENLRMGMKLFFLLQPIYEFSPDLDASCCGILFCKALELYLRNNFVNGLKERFPSFTIKSSSGGWIPLEAAKNKDFMIGAVQYILQNKAAEIGSYMISKGEPDYSAGWWSAFSAKLSQFAQKRNDCCHPRLFSWKDMDDLLRYEFHKDTTSKHGRPLIGGVFYESKNGEKLIDA